jgi:sugar diacid utilization regulator
VADVDNPSDGSGVSVRQLLAEELLCGSLVAGERGLSNVVSWCVPVTPEDTTSSGDLSGVAGYALLPHPTEVLGASLVEGLAKSGASALLVWPGRHGDAPDLSEAARAADAVGLPLLLLTPQASFRETSRLIATKVLAQSTHVLEYGTRVHRTLGDVFARGGGLPALAHTMSQLSGATVLVIGSAGELLTSAAPSRTSVDTTEALVTEVQRATGVLADDVGGEPDGRDADRRGHHHAVARVVTVDVDGTKLDTIVAPVQVAGEPYGLLALVEPVHPAAEHDLSQHMVIAEQGVSLTGSELLRQHSVREAQERARNDFVHALLHGRFTDKLELAARAEHYRFPLAGRFAVYVVTSTRLHPDESASRHKAHDAARLAASAVPPDDRQLTLTALIGSMIVVVRELRTSGTSTSDTAGESEETRIFATRVHRAMAARLGEDVRIAYGRPDNGAVGVARSYREARTAEALGRRVSTAPISAYTDLRVFAAIEDAAMSPAGKAFAASMLAPLQQSDGQTGNLEEVVLAYIEESGNLNATARRLHLHRNTMLYKLDRRAEGTGQRSGQRKS